MAEITHYRLKFAEQPSEFGHTDEPRGSEALKNFDESFCLKFCVKALFARVDADRLKSNELGRRGHAQNVGMADEAKHIRREL